MGGLTALGEPQNNIFIPQWPALYPPPLLMAWPLKKKRFLAAPLRGNYYYERRDNSVI